MKIWVDSDACPKVIKELLYRIAERTGVSISFVANQYLFIPKLPNMDFILVEPGFDIADSKIVQLCAEGNIVITADIPLAVAVIKKGAFALNPRGDLYDSNNIGEILATRDLMDSLRGGLMEQNSGGPAPFSPKDREKFANALDKFMARKV